MILSKLSRKSATCPRRSPWLHIVLVRSLRSARLDTAWLVKSVTYFDLIGKIGGCVREIQRSKYKCFLIPWTLELTGKCGVISIICHTLSSKDITLGALYPQNVQRRCCFSGYTPNACVIYWVQKETIYHFDWTLSIFYSQENWFW